MTQLPPKNKIPNWPEFDNAANITTTIINPTPSWVDEFFDFSEARRMTHRRLVSDPVIFVEAQPVPADNSEFDGFDDEQVINMFAYDNVCPSFDPSNPSTSSSGDGDKESMPNERNNEEQTHQDQMTKKESEGLESLFERAEAGAPRNPGAKMDPKRVKRVLANRQSAQRSRVRKLQYISELERSVTKLQADVFMLSPRVTYLDQQRLLLNVDNSALKQRIAALGQDRIFKDAAHEALTREIERLRELYYQQNLHKMESPAPSPRPSEAQRLLYS